ncbi:hypothetical protein TNCV_3194661 [Trichonephila clavipes]|uniref:Uncharacterized protein n=1 Tax=Trichonephila clavipes TaxID=2585209 RepID=A0A8X6V0V0_TRICX|nr:hypothetical protein TNCV_3194661 [Trichonephila clavipes]
MVLKANDRRTPCPCHDEFRGPRSDYVRQVALATTTTTIPNGRGLETSDLKYINNSSHYSIEWSLGWKRIQLLNCLARISII